jgi:hypothetical protein
MKIVGLIDSNQQQWSAYATFKAKAKYDKQTELLRDDYYEATAALHDKVSCHVHFIYDEYLCTSEAFSLYFQVKDYQEKIRNETGSAQYKTLYKFNKKVVSSVLTSQRYIAFNVNLTSKNQPVKYAKCHYWYYGLLFETWRHPNYTDTDDNIVMVNWFILRILEPKRRYHTDDYILNYRVNKPEKEYMPQKKKLALFANRTFHPDEICAMKTGKVKNPDNLTEDDDDKPTPNTVDQNRLNSIGDNNKAPEKECSHSNTLWLH